ncbi:MAG: L-aspartate oxidase [Thermoanaerobaculales bacterium]|nr:L-aspartate oxidase [Thermoanaerobaculales bacterium]
MSPDRSFAYEGVRQADVVVVGSGIAGLMAALHASHRDVLILSKTGFAEGGSSPYAQGGIAAAVGAGDSAMNHARDTMEAGAGLCREEVVRAVTREGPERIDELLALGAAFDRAAGGALDLGQEGAHDRPRVVHAEGDATGAEVVRALRRAVEAEERVVILDHCLALELLVDRGRVLGLVYTAADGRRFVVAANAVVLATGGIGRLYTATTNPREATGDGLAMAARAGASLAGLEFVQFHPTALDVTADTKPLLTEALRGEGALLVDETGRRILEGVDPRLELAPRDIVARTIWNELQIGRRVLLDATGLAAGFAERFPSVLGLCLAHGLDPRVEPMPVTPAAHYHMGGVVVGLDGSTSLAGLWACGEVSWTGLHGANRLASNSLLEALVYGRRVGRSVAASPRDRVFPELAARRAGRISAGLVGSPWAGPDDPVVAELRRMMWRDVGLVRSMSGLRRAQLEIDRLERTPNAAVGEVANMLTAARLVATAAVLRTESRGAHWRRDMPSTSIHWDQDLFFDGLRPLAPQPRLTDNDRDRGGRVPSTAAVPWEE